MECFRPIRLQGSSVQGHLRLPARLLSCGAEEDETGVISIPKVLAKKGVRDLRVTDGRISGTKFGTIVLHVSPEAYLGGALAIIEDGDYVRLDFKSRRLDVKLSEREIRRRLEGWSPPEPSYDYRRGPHALWYRFCTQAHEGCIYPFM